MAEILLRWCGFGGIRTDVKPRGLGIVLDLVASDRTGAEWAFHICGSFTTGRGGLRRADALWRALGIAAVLHEGQGKRGEMTMPLVLLTTEAPARGTAGHRSLRTVQGLGRPVADVVELLDPEGHDRLRAWAHQGITALDE